MVDAAQSPPLTGPAAPRVEAGHLVSAHPATGAEVGRHPVASTEDVARAVERAREAGQWWSGLGFAERRRRLLRWRSRITQQMHRAADLLHAETGKPTVDGLVEVAATVISMDWAAKHARRVLAPRRVRRVLASPESAGRLEYRPYGVVGVIGPWNYPVLTPMNSIAFALAAGNTVIHKPSEHTPGMGQWLADTLLEVVGEHPVVQVVQGTGEVGEALCRSGVDKLSFTGSTATAKRVMAACADTLTPVVLEAGGKDAIIVDSDADLDHAAAACVWGGFTNAGQTCVSVERVYVVDEVYDTFLSRLKSKVERLTVGGADGHIGPLITPGQLEVVRRHIDDAMARGARAVVGGTDAVVPPYVHPTLLVDVPPDALAMREETFGPVLAVSRVRDVDQALAYANDSPYGLGGAVFGRKRAISIARQLRSGMVSVNDVLSFAGTPSLPWGGIGASGFGRLRGDDGLREFAQPMSVVVRQMREPMRARTFERTDRDVARMVKAIRLMFGRDPG